MNDKKRALIIEILIAVATYGLVMLFFYIISPDKTPTEIRQREHALVLIGILYPVAAVIVIMLKYFVFDRSHNQGSNDPNQQQVRLQKCGRCGYQMHISPAYNKPRVTCPKCKYDMPIRF